MKDINKILDQVSENAKALREAKGIELDPTQKERLKDHIKYHVKNPGKFMPKGPGVEIAANLNLILAALHPADRVRVISEVSDSFEKSMEKHIKVALKEWEKEVKKKLK